MISPLTKTLDLTFNTPVAQEATAIIIIISMAFYLLLFLYYDYYKILFLLHIHTHTSLLVWYLFFHFGVIKTTFYFLLLLTF